jgi:nucleotide-binding universal stress UspA family protein
MGLRHLLVHVDAEDRSAERVDLAVALARRFGARLTGLFSEVSTLGTSIVGRRSPEHLRAALAAARSTFESRTRGPDLDSEWWQLEPAEYAEVVGLTATCCRYVDLAIFGQHDPERGRRVPEELVEHVLAESGRPVLVVPAAGHYADLGKRVLVAWNASRAAARALHDALPLMRGAEAVTVLALQQPSDRVSSAPMPPLDIVRHLAAHGIAAQYERVVKDDFNLVDTLLNRSFELHADLLVMGHAQQARPFGARSASSHDILRSMITPVLMSH